jgi:hypothetical protein
LFKIKREKKEKEIRRLNKQNGYFLRRHQDIKAGDPNETVSFLGSLLFREALALPDICPFSGPVFDFPLKTLLPLGFYKSVFHTRRVGLGFSEQHLAGTEAGNTEGSESVRLIFF